VRHFQKRTAAPSILPVNRGLVAQLNYKRNSHQALIPVAVFVLRVSPAAKAGTDLLAVSLVWVVVCSDMAIVTIVACWRLMFQSLVWVVVCSDEEKPVYSLECCCFNPSSGLLFVLTPPILHKPTAV